VGEVQGLVDEVQGLVDEVQRLVGEVQRLVDEVQRFVSEDQRLVGKLIFFANALWGPICEGMVRFEMAASPATDAFSGPPGLILIDELGMHPEELAAFVLDAHQAAKAGVFLFQ
jgi:hypothetical protein